MDELTLLRSTRDDGLEPSPEALITARAALLNRVADEASGLGSVRKPRAKRRLLPRLTWATAGVAEIDQAGCTREGRSPRDRGRTVRELFRRIGVFRHGRLLAYDGFTKR